MCKKKEVKMIVEIKNEEVVFWKMSLKDLYIKGEISEREFKCLYPPFGKGRLSKEREKEIINMVTDIITDLEHMKNLVKKETNFVLDRKISNTFEKEWGIYLYDCLNENIITSEEYMYYISGVDFSEDLDSGDLEMINEIIDILRVQMVKCTPELISEIENPSFDTLVAANELAFQ